MAKSAKRVDKETIANSKAQILLFGDSHCDAVRKALTRRATRGETSLVRVFRNKKEKANGSIGDSNLDEFLEKIRTLSPIDTVVSMIGGNHHATLSTLQHSRPFDFLEPGAPLGSLDDGVVVIPYRALEGAMRSHMSTRDEPSLQSLKSATKARVVHVMAPPPKFDSDFIKAHADSVFRGLGMETAGVSPARLRLKFWRLQKKVTEDICQDLGIVFVPPPKSAVGKDGFLRPEAYANDATHANHLYGEWVLRELESRFSNGCDA